MANTIARVLTGVANVEIRYPVGGAWVDAGYTADGVTFEYNADTADIEVEEETFPIDRRITKEGAKVTLNMAEGSLYNLDKAMAGGVLAGGTVTLDAGVLKEMQLRLTGTNPTGGNRVILLPLVTATGTSAVPYKKGEASVVPATFEALKDSGGSTCTITDT